MRRILLATLVGVLVVGAWLGSSSAAHDPSASCAGLSQEAESGAVSGALQLFADAAASGGAAIGSTEGSGDNQPGQATYCFTVATPGDYRIDAVVRGPTSLSNSFWVELNTGAIALFDTDSSNAWVTDPVSHRAGADPIVLGLGSGTHNITFHLREDGTQLDLVTLTPLAPPPPPPVPTCSGLSHEAEAGVLTGALQIFGDGAASGGAAIRATEGSGDPAGNASYCFSVSEAGDYRIDSRVRGPNGLSNSFWVQLDGGPLWLFDTDSSNAWVTDPVSNRGGADPIVATLGAGDHEVVVHVREDGTQLDLVTLTLLTPPPPPPVPTCSGLSHEAEAGVLTGSLQVFGDAAASGGAAIRAAEGSGDPAGDATYCFSVSEAGDYRIDARVKGPNVLSNSFWVQLDGGPLWLFDTDSSNAWVTDPVSNRGGADPIVATLGAGDHEVVVHVREDGTQLDLVTLTLLTPPPPPPVPTCSGLSHEAEAGVLTGSMQVFGDGAASGGAAIRAAEGSGDPAGDATYCFTVSVAGDYRIDARVKGPNGLSNSFWVQLDGGAAWLFDTDSSNAWVTDAVSQRGGADPIVVSLSAGEHEVIFHVREDGTQLDLVTLTPLGAAVLFESAHPYANDADELWVYDHGTPGFAFHFSQLELAADGDVVEILDADDNVLETVVGTWAGGYLSVRVPTSVGKVRLVSDSSGEAGGIEVDRAYSIGASILAASASTNPTAVQFGPDGRLYVAQMDGTIHAYTVARNGSNDYAVTATEIISKIRDIPNHDDDGALNAGVVGRLLTGLWIEGTPTNPVIFATSSDPRQGREAGQPNGDTNSGVLSRLTWDGASWVHLDLVRGLPRSAENHASNGLLRDPATNTVYLAQGGHANQGGASALWGQLLPEYALSGAVLSIDLTAIGESTYDLPTLDDPARAGTPDAGDPFGGNDGANQAVIDLTGPVQIHAPGFRNPYDLELTAAGRLYVTDNGPSADFGGPPTDEGVAGICTSAAASPGLWAADGLHDITVAGYYGGHPNPVRGNPAGSPFGAAVPAANPIECDYRVSGIEDDSIASFPASTNGIEEYTPANVDGLLSGNLFTISWDGTLSRVVLTPTGDDTLLVQPFVTGVGVLPLDVTIPTAADPLAGTIWVVDWLTGDIHVFETPAG